MWTPGAARIRVRSGSELVRFHRKSGRNNRYIKKIIIEI
jgi:hypothetical protein